MLCEKCGQAQAQVHYKTVMDGTVEEHYYCVDCSKSLVGFFNGPFGDPFAGMLGNLFTAKPQPEAKVCPVCRKNIREIAASGRMGCPDCYAFFGEEISPYISRLHGTSAHAGKIPRSLPQDNNSPRETARLRAELERAVAAQEYERAAEIRDRINALEGGGGQ